MFSGTLEVGCEYYVKIHMQGLCHSREKPLIPVICQTLYVTIMCVKHGPSVP